MRSKFLAVIITVLILGFTFLRENVFVALNAIIKNQTYNKAYFYWFNDVLEGIPQQDLIRLKWILTAIFSALIIFLTLIVIQLIFGKKYSLIVLKGYGYVIALLVVLFISFSLFGIFNEGYFLLRKILGLIQSPLPLFVIFIVLNYQVKKIEKS